MNRSEVIALMEGGRINGQPIQGKLIETHISWVIMMKSHVLKIKKPIQYSFLDFSTLDKRSYFCHREIVLNKRLTKNVYLDILAIRKGKNGWFIGPGNGQVIEYAVFMKRLQTAKKMDVVMKQDKLSLIHIDRLATKVAAFHQGAEILYTPFDIVKAKEEFNDIDSVAEWTGKHVGKQYSTKIERAIQSSDQFLEKHQELIQDRIFRGMQRDIHGDLHSRNIFLYKNPVIFDCIEFNDSFRQIDVLKEVAFTCMDLDAFDLDQLSKYFINKYVAHFTCIRSNEEWTLFNYYKCYRANVRAKVNAFRAIQAKTKEELDRLGNEVVKYLNLMSGYLK